MTDIEAVEQTVYRYHRYYDDRRLEDVIDLFADDAVMVEGNAGFRVEGRPAIEEFLTRYLGIDEVPSGQPGIPMAHCLVNPLIDVDGDTASAVADYFALLYLDDDPHLAAMGRSSYRLTRAGDRWLLSEVDMQVQVGQAAMALLASRGFAG